MRYSEKEAFNTCPFKYKLTYIDRLKKAEEGTDAKDKNWGAAIHAGLQTHYLGKEWKDVSGSFLSVYPTNLDQDDMAKSVEGGIETLKQYITYWKEQDKMWEILSTEEEGVIEFGGEEHSLHIDLVARHRQTGEIYLWDHKTTGRTPSPTYWKGYELSGQLSRYCAYVQDKYGSCAGAIINNISVGHRQRAYKGEPAGFWCKFERQVFSRSKAQIEYWRRSEEDWMKMVGICRQNNLWPKALGKICGYCEFYELCLSNDDEQIRQLLYITEKEKQSA